MVRGKKGFTLIELVMVIVILGILAAVAIPRFIDLSSSAEVATANGIAGAIMGAATILHADYLINDNSYSLDATEGVPCSINGIIQCDANIAGDVEVTAGDTLTLTMAASSATITIMVNNTPYTMTFTMDSGNGPNAEWSF